MPFFVETDTRGVATAFYNDSVNVVPATALPISDALWEDWISKSSTHRWDGTKLVALPPEPPPPQPIPTITPRQLELWLLSRGVLAQVNALIDALPEPDQTVAKIEWKRSSVFEYKHPLVQLLGAAVGLTEQDIEAGFREAALL